jgi:hypothetical protein
MASLTLDPERDEEKSGHAHEDRRRHGPSLWSVNRTESTASIAQPRANPHSTAPVMSFSCSWMKGAATRSRAATTPVASDPATIRPIWPLRVAGPVVLVSLVLPVPWLGWAGVGTGEASDVVCSALLMLSPRGEWAASTRFSLRRPAQARLREITGICALE